MDPILTPVNTPLFYQLADIGSFLGVRIGSKTAHWGYPGPPFDAVFNRMGVSTESLYARARIGVTDRLKTPQIGPPYATPDPTVHCMCALYRCMLYYYG